MDDDSVHFNIIKPLQVFVHIELPLVSFIVSNLFSISDIESFDREEF